MFEGVNSGNGSASVSDNDGMKLTVVAPRGGFVEVGTVTLELQTVVGHRAARDH